MVPKQQLGQCAWPFTLRQYTQRCVPLACGTLNLRMLSQISDFAPRLCSCVKCRGTTQTVLHSLQITGGVAVVAGSAAPSCCSPVSPARSRGCTSSMSLSLPLRATQHVLQLCLISEAHSGRSRVTYLWIGRRDRLSRVRREAWQAAETLRVHRRRVTVLCGLGELSNLRVRRSSFHAFGCVLRNATVK